MSRGHQQEITEKEIKLAFKFTQLRKWIITKCHFASL